MSADFPLGEKVHHLRLSHVPLGEAFDRGGDRGTEQQRLAILGALPQNFLDIGPKPDVEHPVRFVEYHDFQFAELERSPRKVIEYASGRSHDEIAPPFQPPDLRLDRFATINGHGLELPPMREAFYLVADLYGQFAGRHERQGTRPFAFPRLVHSLENGNRKRGSLPSPRAGLPQDVDTLNRPRNHPRLHGGCRLVADLHQGGLHRVRKIKFSKLRGGLLGRLGRGQPSIAYFECFRAFLLCSSYHRGRSGSTQAIVSRRARTRRASDER